jgi:hypothetical protein
LHLPIIDIEECAVRRCATDPELSAKWRNLAIEYSLLAEKGAAGPARDPSVIPPRPAGEAEAEET